jgi:hypothetical protein
MRKFATIILLLSLSISSFSQADTTRPMTRHDYLARSRGQMIAGFVLLGVGATCAAIAAPGNVSFETLGTLVTVGGVAALVSIPLFIAAGRNKRKARKASAGIDLQKSLLIQPNSYAFLYYPALKLRFRL